MADDPQNRSHSEHQKQVPEDAGAAAERTFVESLVASGQAAKRDAMGRLPPGVTHEIVEDAHGEIQLVRRRFSAY